MAPSWLSSGLTLTGPRPSCAGPQSRWGLTRAEQRGKTPSLALPATSTFSPRRCPHPHEVLVGCAPSSRAAGRQPPLLLFGPQRQSLQASWAVSSRWKNQMTIFFYPSLESVWLWQVAASANTLLCLIPLGVETNCSHFPLPGKFHEGRAQSLLLLPSAPVAQILLALGCWVSSSCIFEAVLPSI